jgi:ribosomal protein S18 acetylase RimI-like enzyme
VEVVDYHRRHLEGIVALCREQGWPSFPDDPPRADRVLQAPGVTAVVAVEGDDVVGFAYLQSDGEIQAHLSNIAVRRDHRRRGIGRALLQAGLARAGGQRIDLVTDSAHLFYEAFEHRRLDGYRLYRSFASPPGQL